MSDPYYWCAECLAMQVVTPDGRGFPPDIAKRKLDNACRTKGHVSKPRYRAGFG